MMSMEEREDLNSMPRPKSVFACLSLGFDVVAQRPTLMLPPLLLDVFLWLGPRLAIPFDPALLAEMAHQLELENGMIAQIQTLWEHYNLFFTLSLAPVINLPSLAARERFWEAPLPRTVLTLQSDLSLLAAFVVLLMIGIALGAAFLRAIALAVLEALELPLPGPQDWGVMSRRLLKLAGLELPFILAGLGLFILLATAIIPQGLGIFLFSAVSLLGLYLGFYLILAVPAVFMAGRQTLAALREVFLLIQVDFLGVFLLYFLSFSLYSGLNILWTAPKPTSWLQLAGLGGHAFIATGLTATLFIFYVNRLEYIRALEQAFATMRAQASATRHS